MPKNPPILRLDADDLAPFISCVVTEIPMGTRPAATAHALGALEERALKRHRGQITHLGVDLSGRDLPEDVQLDGFAYSVSRLPSWLGTSTAQTYEDDVAHELVLTLRVGDLLAIHCSESRLRESIQRWLDGDPAPLLKRVEPEFHNAAFFGGSVRFAWMNGVHSPTTNKADTKALGGLRLQDAFDRVGDHSYAASAVRVVLEGQGESRPDGALIVSPDKSSLSFKQSVSTDDWLFNTMGLLMLLDDARQTGGVERPLPPLQVAVRDLRRVDGAFEMVPPSNDAVEIDPHSSDDTVAAARLLQGAMLDVVGGRGPAAEVAVGLGGSEAGRVQVRLVQHRSRGPVLLDIRPVPGAGDPVIQRQVIAALEEANPTIHFMSGHTWRGGLYSGGQLDIAAPFTGWVFEDFTGYDVHVEKPAEKPSAVDLALETRRGRSLFDWVVRQYGRGWLTCDDGSGEVADFVHIADDHELSLIHVKAATSAGVDRGVAVGPYEQVVSQAAKNCGFLDPIELEGHLSTASGSRASVTFRDGVLADRSGLLAALRNRPPSSTRIVILQPHVREEALNRARADQVAGRLTAAAARAQLLDVLLERTGATARSMGAGFTVIGGK